MTLLEAAKKFVGEVGDKTSVDVDVDILEILHDPQPFGLTAGELSRKIEQSCSSCQPGFNVDGSGAEALLYGTNVDIGSNRLMRKIEQKTEDRIDNYIEQSCGYEPGFGVDGEGAEALLCDDRPQSCTWIAGKTTLAHLALKLEGGGGRFVWRATPKGRWACALRLDDTVTQYDGFFGAREVFRGDPLAAGPAGLADVYLYTYRDGSRVIRCGELLDELDEAGCSADGTQWIDEAGQEVGRATLNSCFFLASVDFAL